MSEAYAQPGLRSLSQVPDLDQIVVALVTEYTSPLEKYEQPGDLGPAIPASTAASADALSQ